MKKSLLKNSVFALMMLAGVASMSAQENAKVVTVGSFIKPVGDAKFPLYTDFENSESEMIYTAADLQALPEGDITKIEFAVYGGQYLYTDMYLWLENTSDTQVGEAFKSTDEMVKVYEKKDRSFTAYDGNANAPSYMEFEFDNKFEYTGGGLRVHLASLSQYYCSNWFTFVNDSMKEAESTTNNSLMNCSYTKSSMKMQPASRHFPIIKVTITPKTTGITGPTVDSVKDVTYYNIYGQKVDADAKGLIITSDGKKFFRN